MINDKLFQTLSCFSILQVTEAGRGLVIRLGSGAIWLTSVSNVIVDSHTESGLCVQSLPDGITTVMFNIVQVNLNYKTTNGMNMEIW